jgi:hypothetical protein
MNLGATDMNLFDISILGRPLISKVMFPGFHRFKVFAKNLLLA